jgi:chromosome segregation ATPase
VSRRAARRRESLELELTRAGGAIERLIEAYQEQLLSLDELRARMPTLRKRQSTLRAQLDTLDTELQDAETYLKLADSLEGVPRPTRRRTQSAQPRGTATRSAARRPRSTDRWPRRHDDHPTHNPHPHRAQ